MRLDTYQPKFHPRTLTFETQEEWSMFIAFINNSEIIDTHPECDQLTDFGWSIYQLISEGLDKI